MADLSTLTLNIRVTVDGQPAPALWRVRLLGRVARLLRVPLSVKTDKIR
jgi:hypothetical protein